jgi:transposase
VSLSQKLKFLNKSRKTTAKAVKFEEKPNEPEQEEEIIPFSQKKQLKLRGRENII